MSCSTKPSSMATNSCLISLPSLYTTSKKTISYAYPYAYASKPFKISLSCSYSSSSSSSLFSLKKRRTPHFQTIFAQQEEDNNTIVLQEEEEENFKWGNQGSSENEDETGGGIEAFGDSGEESDGFVDAVADAAGEGEESDGFVDAVADAAGEGEEEVEYQEPPEDAKLFVGNLPYDIDSEKLAHLFEQAGVVEIAEVIYNRETDRSRGFGFVTMSTVEEAEKAVEMFNRYDLNGRLLTVNKAAPRGSRPERVPRVFEPSYRVYVGNLPWDVDDARLEQLFSEHGKVISARVVYDRETGRSRGFGFVTMSSESELNDAIDNLDGQSLDGRTIRVNVAEERPRRI